MYDDVVGRTHFYDVIVESDKRFLKEDLERMDKAFFSTGPGLSVYRKKNAGESVMHS